MPAVDLDDYCAANQPRFVDELIQALRIPSISADPAHAADVRRNEEFFRDAALAAWFTNAEIGEPAGHPAVYSARTAGTWRPGPLIYERHAIQPVDPL